MFKWSAFLKEKNEDFLSKRNKPKCIWVSNNPIFAEEIFISWHKDNLDGMEIRLKVDYLSMNLISLKLFRTLLEEKKS